MSRSSAAGTMRSQHFMLPYLSLWSSAGERGDLVLLNSGFLARVFPTNRLPTVVGQLLAPLTSCIEHYNDKKFS